VEADPSRSERGEASAGAAGAAGATGTAGAAAATGAAGAARSSPRGTLTLLAIGDVHLGTRPSGLPAELADLGRGGDAITPAAALAAAVERAVAEGVDGVLFAGDVVESTNARFEAFRPLEAAVRHLAEAEIPVLAVAGNHDGEALPRLADRIEGFRLLGAGGRWEIHRLEGAGGGAAEVLGWSFPEARVSTSPVAELLRRRPPPPAPGVARIGLLHGDLDASGGAYAPFRRRELEDARLDAWLLGHIHAPSLGRFGGGAGPGATPCGYLGSLLPLDPTETGLHGPWRVRVHPGGRVETEPLPNGLLRWERLEVGVPEGAEASGDVDAVADAILDAAAARARELRDAGEDAAVLGVRARLVGRTRRYEALRRWIEDSGWQGRLVREVGDTTVFVEAVSDGLTLAVDLETLARGDDPPALLARKLLALESGGEPRRALLEAAREALRPAAGEPVWQPLAETRDAGDPLADEALAGLLRQSGIAMLDALLAQRRSGGEERGR